jgi:hypothetical protein
MNSSKRGTLTESNKNSTTVRTEVNSILTKYEGYNSSAKNKRLSIFGSAWYDNDSDDTKENRKPSDSSDPIYNGIPLPFKEASSPKVGGLY